MACDVDLYDYRLPRELIAQNPLPQRADARLLLVDRHSGTLEHHHFRDLPHLLRPGDCLVLNDTRVLPARLVGYRTETGGRWQGLFLSADAQGQWQLLGKSRGKLSTGQTVTLQDRWARDDSRLRLVGRLPDGVWLAQPEPPEEAPAVLERVGRVPLPHYIRGGEMLEADRQRYQTVFARRPGSVAAPTAGLHFTTELLEQLKRRDIQPVWVTLHVGAGTFRPITAASVDEHRMQGEWAELSEPVVDVLRRCRQAGGRIVAVGSTCMRVLESAAQSGSLRPFRATTDLYIRPPYTFRAVDALVTNFHLPMTTLLVLVHTFGGHELIRRAYEVAIEQRYRFFSYGDAMLIV